MQVGGLVSATVGLRAVPGLARPERRAAASRPFRESARRGQPRVWRTRWRPCLAEVRFGETPFPCPGPPARPARPWSACPGPARRASGGRWRASAAGCARRRRARRAALPRTPRADPWNLLYGRNTNRGKVRLDGCTHPTHAGGTPMTRIGIILGSTRPNRNGEQVARWVYDIASRRDDAEFELVDLRDYPLPHLDEPLPPSMRQYHNQHTRQWADKIASFDGFVIVTPEYNHSTSGA